MDSGSGGCNNEDRQGSDQYHDRHNTVIYLKPSHSGMFKLLNINSSVSLFSKIIFPSLFIWVFRAQWFAGGKFNVVSILKWVQVNGKISKWEKEEKERNAFKCEEIKQ